MTSETFIQAMRMVAQSVSVVTTNGPAGRHGATVSAFCSVAAEPPTVLVCLNSQSKIAHMVAQNKCFTVNILPENAYKIAKRFAGFEDQDVEDRFEGIDLQSALVPEISGSSVFVCNLIDLIPSGTHFITLGRVTRSKIGTSLPLTYFNGAYATLATAEEHA